MDIQVNIKRCFIRLQHVIMVPQLLSNLSAKLAIRSVLTQYNSVLTSLGEMAESSSPSAASANGLQQQFMKGNTVLGFVVAEAVIGELECLNTSLQRKTQTISGMKTAVCCVQSTLKGKRNDNAFQSLFEKASTIVDSLDLEPITVPQIRQPPQVLKWRSKPKTSIEHYREEFCA